MPMYRTVKTALTTVEAMIQRTRKAAAAMEPTLSPEIATVVDQWMEESSAYPLL